MIFCFVRETKQLTLEEIDRKFHRNHLQETHPIHHTNTHHRGLPGPDQEVHQPRTLRLAPVVPQSQGPPTEYPEAASDHRF